MDRATEYFQDLHFKITTGSRYLGGFVGSRRSCEEYDKREGIELGDIHQRSLPTRRKIPSPDSRTMDGRESICSTAYQHPLAVPLLLQVFLPAIVSFLAWFLWHWEPWQT
jgi:hypothetical protein